jgi:trans-2-enoyl-CoA reductase
MSFTLRGFLQSPVTCSISSPGILLSTLFSDDLSLCSYLIVSQNIVGEMGLTMYSITTGIRQDFQTFNLWKPKVRPRSSLTESNAFRV